MSSSHPEENPLSIGLVDAWREDRASPAELRRGYERFLRSQRKKRGAPLLRFILLGSLLGVGLAQGATLAPWRWLGLGRRSEVVRPAPAIAPATSPARPALPSAADVSPAPAAREAEPTHVEAPKVATASSAAVAAHVQVQWQRAAAAIKANELNQALRALLDIERSTGGGERDAARLTRAQLLMSHGRGAEATSLLADLEQHAQSSVVRSKARAALRQSAVPADSDRSPAVGHDTKQP